MSTIIKKFELFLEKNKEYTDSKIRSIMKYAIKEAFNTLKKKIKESKTVEEVKSIESEIVEEINKLRDLLSGTIVLAINENVNEASVISTTLSNLKNFIKDLLHKKTDSLDLAKKEALAKIDKVYEDLMKFIKAMDLDVEKTNAKIAKSKNSFFRSQIF